MSQLSRQKGGVDVSERISRDIEAWGVNRAKCERRARARAIQKERTDVLTMPMHVDYVDSPPASSRAMKVDTDSAQ